MRNRLIACVVASAALAIPLMGASAANAAPQHKINAGFVVETPYPGNGGDWGWGNCGHNSSVGQPHTGDQAIGLGNGGDRKDECLAPIIPS